MALEPPPARQASIQDSWSHVWLLTENDPNQLRTNFLYGEVRALRMIKSAFLLFSVGLRQAHLSLSFKK